MIIKGFKIITTVFRKSPLAPLYQRGGFLPLVKGGEEGFSNQCQFDFETLNKKEAGFSLVELMITMVVFVFFIAAASQVFTGLLTQFKQQSKMAETNIEGMVGLEMLRQDIESAGYGLPWNVTGVTDADNDGNFWEHLPNYSEAATGSSPDPASFNDATRNIDGDGSDGEAPRAILSENDVTTYSAPNDIFNHSDYLVIKSVSVARNFAAGKYQFLYSDGQKNWWVPHWENVCRKEDNTHYPNVRVIIISPGTTVADSRSLGVSGGSFFAPVDSIPSGFRPAFDRPSHIIYGVDPDTNLRMPFNRADYYIKIPATNMPQRCANNTGVLYKATLNHADGAFSELPILDCVADMQVIYALDNNEDGDFVDGAGGDGYSDDITTAPLTAQQIRTRVKQVRVYILSHDGQRDMGFNFNNFNGACSNCILVGEFGLGRDFDLATITDYQYYHWKLYTIVVAPHNLE